MLTQVSKRSLGGRWDQHLFALPIVRGVNSVPPGSPGSPFPPPRLVRRLHVDLCRLASCLCRA
ncbi:putative leader peptide [Actinomadura macrotermitis]|uniref:putative leader peptide n=1 Tax=Actinomadura macrotermitis TaxID=2585200 RepID=UPI0038B35EB4